LAKYTLPREFWPMLIGGVILILIAIGAQALWPNGLPMETTAQKQSASSVTEIHGSGPIRINELMSSNSATLIDENGNSADWIEIANIGNRAVDLTDYSIAKNENATNRFIFPNRTLEPGECVIVFADSTLRNAPDAEYHAPFRLSSMGGSLMLFNPSGIAIDSVNYPELSADMAYLREGRSTWTAKAMPTPRLENTQANYDALHMPISDAGVEITELMASNTKVAPDENGVYHDYFELHNRSDTVADLSGWFVSDDLDKPAKWRLPEGFVIQPGEYRIIYCSSLDRKSAEFPHTNFGLSSEGEAVVLSDRQGRIVSQIEYGLMKADTAYLKQEDGSWTMGTPSPKAR
jgi:hypothetical protein